MDRSTIGRLDQEVDKLIQKKVYVRMIESDPTGNNSDNYSAIIEVAEEAADALLTGMGVRDVERFSQ